MTIRTNDPSRHALLPNLKSFRGLTPAAREFSSLLTSSMPRDLRLRAPSLRLRRRNQSFTSCWRWKWCCPIWWGGFESTRTNKSSLSHSDIKGLHGTYSVKKIKYQTRIGEWNKYDKITCFTKRFQIQSSMQINHWGSCSTILSTKTIFSPTNISHALVWISSESTNKVTAECNTLILLSYYWSAAAETLKLPSTNTEN